MLINNPWGAVATRRAWSRRGKADPSIEIAGIEKFENNDVDMVPQLTRLKEAGADAIILVGQCAARRAGDEVARAHGLDGAGGVALGHFRRALPGARRADRRRSALRPDLQLLRQAERRPASACWRRCMKKYPQIKGPEDVVRAGRHGQRLRRHAHSRARRSRRPARPTAMQVREALED